jgi:hypothetical protein
VSDRSFIDYFRCPESLAAIGSQPQLCTTDGFFKFGEAIVFGRCANPQQLATYASDRLADISGEVTERHGRICLPFNLTDVATNLREERYRHNGYTFLQKTTAGETAQRLYYSLRPWMGVPVRRQLQKIRLNGWEKIPFPSWPVDLSVDQLMEHVMAVILKKTGQASVPFIWFWPDGSPSAAMMTHDVEGPSGLDRCDELMDLDDEYGVKSAFQLIPEGQDTAWRETAARLRARGFEVNIHDLNHDGRLFANREEFLERAQRINGYARELGCDGFRSAVMYRRQQWFDAFEFAYDMSVPNAAHLEPQRGGCCTVMPYFVGNLLELPLTTTQDYSLFHILGDYSTRLWKTQIELITARHGLVSVITHPDYLVGSRERDVYRELLTSLVELRERKHAWMALPGEINRWWRNRQRMQLVPENDGWRIEGPDCARARVAYATLENERVVYHLGRHSEVHDSRSRCPA